jgi:hypothetical protein
MGNNYPASIFVDVHSAVEDANYLYILNNSGAILRCAPANCQSTQTTLVSSSGSPSGYEANLFQDSAALYWVRRSPNQIMRLAK